MADEKQKLTVEFLFANQNNLYTEFKKIIYEILYAIALPCAGAGNENVFYKMTAIINSRIFGKIKIRDLVLVLSKENLLKICNALRAILDRLGYYEENSKLQENGFLKKCQTVIDFLSAVQMCEYQLAEEEDFVIDEDDPYMPRLSGLADAYFEALSNSVGKIGDCWHTKFCEIEALSKNDSALIEAELCKIVHPAIAEVVDSLGEAKSEALVSSLEGIYNLMGCTQSNSRCEKRSIVLKLIEFTKVSQAYIIFKNFLRKHYKK